MLRHLSKSDLPLDAGDVLRELKLQNICYAGANSRQKMAYVLLREISGAGSPPLPVLYVNTKPVLKVKGPDRQTIVDETIKALKIHEFPPDEVPWVYDNTTTEMK